MERPQLPAEVEGALARLSAAGIAAWVVGGALRDLALGRPARDFDLAVARPLSAAAQALPEAVAIGQKLPLLLIERPEQGVRIEVGTLRGGARDIAEDLRRRDFTLNALALDAGRGEWIDPLGGRADLAARRLRACDPATCFRDDPVRILRGVRLASELELDTDANTERAMEREHWRLASAPGERLRDELFRLLALERASESLETLRRRGALAALLPELLRGVGIAQNRHHGDDVYRHTLLVCAALPPRPLLRLAGLLHDVAKPETKGFPDRGGDVSFHRHERLARPHLLRVAERLVLSKRDLRTIEGLVRHHLLFEEQLRSDRAIRRMLRRVGSDILEDLLLLRRADLQSRGPVPEAWQACEARIRDVAGALGARLAINGGDVMKLLSIGDGPQVGRWLLRLRRFVEEHPEENERERLLAWLRSQADRPVGE